VQHPVGYAKAADGSLELSSFWALVLNPWAGWQYAHNMSGAVITESSDMLQYLAGVNEHAVLRIVGSKRWSVAHFLKTIQYLLEYGGRFLTT